MEIYVENLNRLLKKRIYVVFLVLIGTGTFGFEVTHFAMGIDDFGINHYMNLSPDRVGNMLQQGRLLHILVYSILGLVDVIPFLNNFIAAILFCISCVLNLVLIESISDHEFTNLQEIVFTGIYISYSIISFKFIYDLDVVVTMMAYVFVPLAVLFSFDFYKRRNVTNFIKSVLSLSLAIGAYESFNAVFVCTVLITLSCEVLYKNEKTKKVLSQGITCCIILIVTLVVYYSIVRVAQVVTNNQPYDRRNIFAMGFPIKDVVVSCAGRLLNFNLFFAIEFTIAAVICVILALYFSKKNKRPVIFFLFAGFGVFTLFVQIIQGFLLYRSCQTFNLFIAMMALLCVEFFENNVLGKKIIVVFMCVVIVLQLKDVNLWFYKDYINYQKNVFAIHKIATDLNSGFGVDNKPVCFLNRDYESFLMTWDTDQQEIGESPIVSSIAFLGNSTSPELIQLFKYQGYDFLIEPSKEQVEEAQGLSVGMSSYPKDGYIQENSEYIIVNLGECQ